MEKDWYRFWYGKRSNTDFTKPKENVSIEASNTLMQLNSPLSQKFHINNCIYDGFQKTDWGTQANELGRKDVFFEAVVQTEEVVYCGPGCAGEKFRCIDVSKVKFKKTEGSLEHNIISIIRDKYTYKSCMCREFLATYESEESYVKGT